MGTASRIADRYERWSAQAAAGALGGAALGRGYVRHPAGTMLARVAPTDTTDNDITMGVITIGIGIDDRTGIEIGRTGREHEHSIRARDGLCWLLRGQKEGPCERPRPDHRDRRDRGLFANHSARGPPGNVNPGARMTDPWATAERARCLTELAAVKQGGKIQFDEGSGPRDITEDHIGRLEKWVQVLDAIIEDERKEQQHVPDQDHVDHGDRGQSATDG